MRKSVRAIGRCAIKVESAAQRCVSTLVELIQTKVTYVVQEAVVVIKVKEGTLCSDVEFLCDFLFLSAARTSSASIPASMRASSLLSVRTWIHWTSPRPGSSPLHNLQSSMYSNS